MKAGRERECELGLYLEHGKYQYKLLFGSISRNNGYYLSKSTYDTKAEAITDATVDARSLGWTIKKEKGIIVCDVLHSDTEDAT